MFFLVYDRGFIFVNNRCLFVDDAKFNIYINPIYRQQLNTDIATFLNVCFLRFSPSASCPTISILYM